jgi:glyceraldehyde 3-phosphate dehydrogenase
MISKVAINGLGRIGRALLKLVIDEPSLELVAVNDLVDAETLAYLVRFDTVYGRYSSQLWSSAATSSSVDIGCAR